MAYLLFPFSPAISFRLIGKTDAALRLIHR
jgi:hypothetical protein